MPNNSTNISVPVKGMNTDIHPMNLGEQSYDFALNTVVEEFTGNGFPLLQNESSNLLCTNFPNNYKVVGSVNIIEQDRKVLFLVNEETGFSQIGEVIRKKDCDDVLQDDPSKMVDCSDCGGESIQESKPLEQRSIPNCCEYFPIVTQTCLNFNINNPVRAVYRLDDCGLSIFFTDNNSPQRYIELEYQDEDISKNLIVKDEFKVITGFADGDCKIPIYGTQVDCNKLQLDPEYRIPCVELVDVIAGGELLAGVYQFVIAYADETGGKRTPYLPATNPVSIFTRQETFLTNYQTDRAIQLNIQGDLTNPPFEYYNIAVIKTIDNASSYQFIGTFPITQKTVTYTGLEKSLIDIDISEIFEPKVFYGEAKYVAKSNDILFWAGLTETKKLNVQRIANNVKLHWQTIAIPEGSYSQPRISNKFRSYMRDEVYSLGLVLIYANGEESVVGHIPGPSKEYFQSQYALNVDQIISGDDVISDPTCANQDRNKRWQVYNTAQLIFTNPSVDLTSPCEEGRCYQYGDFAYWESIEKYPNEPEIWGDLCGKPIRHHKFPDSSVTHIHDGLNTAKQFKDTNIIFPIGIRVDHQSVLDAISTAISEGVITSEDASKIQGYRIVRGNRFGNKSVVAKGLLYDVWNYEKDGNTYYYPNYPYNDLRNDVFISNSRDGYEGSENNDEASGPPLAFEKTKRYTFHSPDTHFTQPQLGEEIKLETEEYGKAETYFNHADGQPKQKLLSSASYFIALTGGILAMLLATEEVREKRVTKVGNVTVVGTQAIPLVEGAATAVVTIPGSGPTSLTHTHILAADIGYEMNTGLPLGPTGHMVTTITKKNTREQYLTNPISSIFGIFTVAQSLFYKMGLVLTETYTITNFIKSLVPAKNYSIQANSIGVYNNYKTIDNNGFKRRRIESHAYLKPEVASISENFSNILFNNWRRETSVYLKTETSKSAFNNPSVTDNSRFAIQSNQDFNEFDKKRFYKDISSFYASLKRYVPDQYGTIANIEYIDTGHCVFFKDEDYATCEASVFGGDVFINRFGLKRKHSFFLQSFFGLPDEIDQDYTLLGNAGYPRYFYKSVTGLAEALSSGFNLGDLINPLNLPRLLGRPISFLDCKTAKFFYQNGKIYLYNYGIPYFLVESDINVDYRHAENTREKDFYPRNSDLDFWLQEKNVSPAEDNYYFYNRSYSKQNKEHFYGQYPRNYEPGRMCRVEHANRVIASNGMNWLNYKANDFKDYSRANGKLTGVDGIENEKVLVRFENTMQVFNAYVTIPTSADTIAVGTGGPFASKPQEFANTTLGYGGSQHAAILHTEFGHVWVDAKRGQVFNINGSDMDEISKYGKKNWFKENLPFQILKDFPNLTTEELDNNFKNIGIVLAFDKRFNRFLLTKLDYKSLTDNVEYNSTTKQFVIKNTSQVVDLKDKKYFCNKSWTISYNFYTKSWVSFHSYLPNFYIDGVDYFSSGINGDVSSLWIHNMTNKSYQVFYGKLWPFTIQTITKSDIYKNNVNSVEYGLDVIRYHNDYDSFYTNDVTFNKAVVFTQNQNSGLLELDFNTKKDLFGLINYPIVNAKSTTIRVTNADGIWRFNQFYDLVKSRDNNIPIWKNNCANSEKLLNDYALDYQMPDLDKKRIRGEWVKVKLTNDIHSNYKMIFKWLVNKSVKTYR